MTPTLSRELDRLGVVVPPDPKPKKEYPPAWKPSYPGEDPPF